MEPESRDWPSDRWRLTAPEAYVLQEPRQLSGVEAFKLALRELVLRRALRVEQVESAGLVRRGRPRTALRAGTRVTEPALAPLLEVHARVDELGAGDGVLMEDFAKAARREFGRTFAGYVDDHVYPSLEARGLISSKEERRWGLFRRRGHERTPAGRDAAAELDDWLRVGRERVEGWAQESPQRALAYAGGAGAAILLLPELYPEFERLARHAAPGAPLAGGEFDFDAFGSTGDSDVGGAFDAFDSFDSIDAGVDAGAGWGGDGGGGGGDGGGGGNGGGGG